MVILACAAHVDRNLIRAAIAQTIETRDDTSRLQRSLALQAEVNEKSFLDSIASFQLACVSAGSPKYLINDENRS